MWILQSDFDIMNMVMLTERDGLISYRVSGERKVFVQGLILTVCSLKVNIPVLNLGFP